MGALAGDALRRIVSSSKDGPVIDQIVGHMCDLPIYEKRSSPVAASIRASARGVVLPLVKRGHVERSRSSALRWRGLFAVARVRHVPEAPRIMEAKAAADVLRRKLRDPRKPMTIADASVESGLALRDVESGLTYLTHEYRGHLRVTEDGDLLYVFPHGFEKPWEPKKTWDAVVRALAGAGRFLIRAWLLVAMVTYALVFVALFVGLAVAGRSSDDRHGGLSVALAAIMRAVADALFWTLHPWSPLYVADRFDGHRWQNVRREPEVPFYEKVNRFVFGPPPPAVDPHAMRARVLEEIRAKKGRIGLADVMRITGLPRHEADPLMARLMLDHDGTVEVGEQGGIVYRFEALRRTAGRPPVRARPAWLEPKTVPPLTGNSIGANVAIALLNLFNLLASTWAFASGLTLSNLAFLLFSRPARGEAPIVLPDDGVPIALGLVPMIFSAAIFAMPAIRALLRTRKEREVARENARLAILREVLARAPRKEPVPDEALRQAYRIAAGEEPSSKEITRRVVELGGDVDTGPNGEVRYRFVDLEAEAEALEEERQRADDAEARVGRVVFASDD